MSLEIGHDGWGRDGGAASREKAGISLPVSLIKRHSPATIGLWKYFGRPQAPV